MSQEDILAGVEKYVRKYFGKRGEKVVQENLRCVKLGLTEVQEVPAEIIHAGSEQTSGELVAAK
jgi:pyruvate-ferredoxin/flavodoxin oxidoreductase